MSIAQHRPALQKDSAMPDPRAAFADEQRHLGASCDFPGCASGAARGSRMCDHHALVRIASNGSWVDDHHPEGGHG